MPQPSPGDRPVRPSRARVPPRAAAETGRRADPGRNILFARSAAPSPALAPPSAAAETGRRAAAARSVLFALLAATAACGAPRTGPPAHAAAVPVTVARVARKDVPLEIRSIGRAEAFSEVEIRSQVEGGLETVNFQEGQSVRRGELLFTVDRRPYEAALAQAEAQLASDLALAKTAEAEVDRYEELAGKNKEWVPAQQLTQLHSVAEAARERAAADRAAVDLAKLKVSYCRITAPIPGRAGTILVHAGNTIKANDAPLVVLLQTAPINVSFAVPEKYLASIQQRSAEGRLEVTAAPPDSKGDPQRGLLSFLDNAVNAATGTIQLKGRFPNADEALWPGQFVEVVLRLATEKGAVVVPAQAVQTGQQGSFVFVVKPDGTADSRPVTVSREYMEEAVIGTGLAPGESVVTDGQLRLFPGAKVEIKESLGDKAESRS